MKIFNLVPKLLLGNALLETPFRVPGCNGSFVKQEFLESAFRNGSLGTIEVPLSCADPLLLVL
jgi:hypothetical protein